MKLNKTLTDVIAIVSIILLIAGVSLVTGAVDLKTGHMGMAYIDTYGTYINLGVTSMIVGGIGCLFSFLVENSRRK